jgi:hypothetical protein
MGNLNLLGMGKSSDKTRVVGMKAYDMNMNEVPMDKELPPGKYVVVSIIKRDHPTYPYIHRFFCIVVRENGEIDGEMRFQLPKKTPDVSICDVGIVKINCQLWW